MGSAARGTLRPGPLGRDVPFPGPSGVVWALELLVFAIAVAGVGELVRHLAAFRVPLFRSPDPLERGLLDLYLGGAVLYVLAAVPIAIFYPATVVAVLVGAALALALIAARAFGRRIPRELRQRAARWLRSPPHLLTFAVTLGLFALELSAIVGIGSGNTYDASLLSTYTSLLLNHHTLPLSLDPAGAQVLSYPQGTTAWLGAAQGLYALPPIRTSLLVTPLFLSLAPLGAYVVGRRVGGGPWTGASMAFTVGLLAAVTRGMVAGSNDFVFATPLVLLLMGWSVEWARPTPPGIADAAAFGAVAGYAAALNPVGPIWLYLSLPVLGLVARPGFGGALRAWALRWGTALAASLVFVAPSLYGVLRSPASAGLSPGGTAASVGGESISQFLGDIDPFLFRAQDQSLSPFPLLRAELAVLIVLGVLIVWIGGRRLRVEAAVGRTTAIWGAVLIALLGAGTLANAGLTPFPTLFRFTSAAELSALLFLLYALVAAIPLAVALGSLARHRAPSELPSRGARAAPRVDLGRVAVPALVALAILLPGAVVSTTELPGQLHSVYADFSNLTSADLDLLAWAPGHLPPPQGVLVAPGSVAEFLPAYDPSIVLLYPMAVDFLVYHPLYWTVVDELTNGTLDSAGRSALHAIGAEFVVVTEQNTVLFRPLDPAPLLAAPFPILFHEGGVYVFDVSSA